MKKILFVAYSLTGGGAEKALVNLLNLIDYDKYEVSLQLFENRGINLSYLPKEVTLLPDLTSQQWLLSPKKDFAKKALGRGRFDLILKRMISILKPIIVRNTSKQYKNLCRWEEVRKDFPKSGVKYDIAIAYLQGFPIYYVLDCVKADRKIGWMHIDYSKIDNVPRDKVLAYYKRLDAFISMSQKCVDILKDTFPSIKEKIHLLHNLNSSKLIYQLAGQEEAGELLDTAEPTILTIGRLCKQKGYDYAIEAAAIMAENHVPFCWFVLGTGELEQELKELAKKHHLEKNFIFLGTRGNPYPYIQAATIIAQPSRYEGKSVVLDEAKILKKPIVVTNYTSVYDQIEDGVTGLIVDMNAQAIADGITKLILNKDMREQLKTELEKVKDNSQYWLNRHYEIFEGK